MAIEINGNEVAEHYLEELKHKVIKDLHIIQVGDDPATNSYIKSKFKMAEKVGMNCVLHKYRRFTYEGIASLINCLNNDENTSGIILQLPVGDMGMESDLVCALIGMIDSNKDVDGFIEGSGFTPCTVKGVLTLIKHFNIETSGANIVILGRSEEVGRPLARILSDREYNATVTMCNSKTRDITLYTKNADIIISAIGKPQFIKSDMIKEGAVCIDVGINSIPDSSKKSGYRLVGDFDFEDCKAKASAITKTPGGTGPMTVLSLIQNCAEASKKTYNELMGD